MRSCFCMISDLSSDDVRNALSGGPCRNKSDEPLWSCPVYLEARSRLMLTHLSSIFEIKASTHVVLENHRDPDHNRELGERMH